MDESEGHHSEGAVVLWAVRWSCEHGASRRELEEMRAERGDAIERHLPPSRNAEAAELLMARGKSAVDMPPRALRSARAP